jgi:hypothetical protein
VAVAMLAVIIKSWSLARIGKWRAALPAVALLVLCATVPIGAWCLWCNHAFGDFTGSSAKIQSLGWIRKPFLDWWRHPIFTPFGFLTFWSELIASFWRGEFVWRHRRLAIFAVDVFYWLSSLLLPAAAVASLFWKRAELTAGQRHVLWLSLGCFAAAVSFPALASIAFDFRFCTYPSAEYPYMTSGRLLCGALIPFLLVYTYGLDIALGPFKSGAARMLALAAVVLLMTASEFILNLPVFSSEYNWFHL